jgi:CRP-like cAMP-binding protein
MSRNDIQKLMVDKPTVAVRILEAVGQRLVAMTTRLEETAFLGAQERVAALLLRLATHKDGQLIVEGYSHQDLAYMLGTYRETVTNALDHLKADGLIEVGRKRVVLLQPERIREIAQEDESLKSSV